MSSRVVNRLAAAGGSVAAVTGVGVVAAGQGVDDQQDGLDAANERLSERALLPVPALGDNDAENTIVSTTPSRHLDLRLREGRSHDPLEGDVVSVLDEFGRSAEGRRVMTMGLAIARDSNFQREMMSRLSGSGANLLEGPDAGKEIERLRAELRDMRDRNEELEELNKNVILHNDRLMDRIDQLEGNLRKALLHGNDGTSFSLSASNSSPSAAVVSTEDSLSAQTDDRCLRQRNDELRRRNADRSSSHQNSDGGGEEGRGQTVFEMACMVAAVIVALVALKVGKGRA